MSEGTRYRGPLIAGFYVCRDCGSVVGDRTRHDRWHDQRPGKDGR
jgi:hypothetical protein